MMALDGSAPDAGEKTWRCFHCDEVFDDMCSARHHFGFDPSFEPACRIKGAEGSLLAALRKAEGGLADAWATIHDESAEAVQAMRAQAGRHHNQLQAAEELGFERGTAQWAKVADDIRHLCHTVRRAANARISLLYSTRQALERVERVVGASDSSPAPAEGIAAEQVKKDAFSALTELASFAIESDNLDHVLHINSLESAIRFAIDAASTAAAQPHGYLYEYPAFPRGTVLRHESHEINGARPIRAVPYFLHPSTLPAGWKLVPIEPTDNMVCDGHECAEMQRVTGITMKSSDWPTSCKDCADLAKAVYRVMIDAAPTSDGIAK